MTVMSLVSTMHVHYFDSYDHANNLLTIPMVLIGSAIDSNVIVTLGRFVGDPP
jgi:hypothetical protein